MEPEKKSKGALIGSIIIIVILVIGAIYIWQTEIKKGGTENTIPMNNVATDENTTDLNNLEADVNATDTNINIDVNKVQ